MRLGGRKRRQGNRRESQIQAQETPSVFHRRAQRNAFRRRDARQQRTFLKKKEKSLDSLAIQTSGARRGSNLNI
jgi:hypothetical protein